MNNAKNKTLAQSPQLPNVESGITSWFQQITFITLVTSVVNYQAQQIETEVSFLGVMQPLEAEKLQIKPEVMRSYIWHQLHCETSLELQTNEIVEYESVKYQVMAKYDYSKYGYYEYHLIEKADQS